MKIRNRLLSMLLAVMMVNTMLFCGIITVCAEEADLSETGESGTTGDCTWTLNGTELIISGNGKMADYGNFGNVKTWGKAIKKLTIKNGVTHIGDNAFFECTSLTDVSIADSVTSIGKNAFFECSALKSILIPDSVTELGESAFCFCGSLTSFTFPDSVTSIAEDMFWQCNSLTDVWLGSSIVSIEKYAFNGCKNLQNVHFSDSVESIGEYAFYSCPRLETVRLSSSLTSIGAYAFNSCTNLRTTVPDSVISIGNSAFYGTQVTSVISDNVIYLGKVAYGLTKGDISSVTIKDGAIGLGDDFAVHDDNLVSVSIPDTVVNIGKNAFYSCDSLADITIPDSVKYIDDQAFLECPSMKSITIPASVTKIGKYALGYLGSAITYLAKTPIDGFTIYGNDGTEAQRYANDNGFIFIAIGEKLVYRGDADGDGQVTILDATQIQKKLANLPTVPTFNESAARIDGENLNILHATYIQKFLAQLPCPKGIGEAMG